MPRSKTVTVYSNVVKQMEVAASVQPAFGVCKGRVTLGREYQGVFQRWKMCIEISDHKFPDRCCPRYPIECTTKTTK
jgi:hypothetical protein